MFKILRMSALLLSLCAPAHAGAEVKLGHRAALTGGEYTTGGGITVAMETRNIGGRLGLCGVWAQSTSMSVYTRRSGPFVLARGVASLGGEVVSTDFRFLNRVRPAPSYGGAPARCIVLDRAWQPRFASAPLSLRLPRQKIFHVSENRKNNGPRVFFTRSDKANPALGKGSFLPSSITSFSSGTTQY